LSENKSGKTSLVPSKQSREFLGEACTAYQQQLTAEAREYLTTVRNLSADRQAFFRLGYVDDPLPGHEKYAGRIAVPYLTRSGVVMIKFRSLNDAKPKYLNLSGQPTRIFNPAALFSHKPYIAICEGEFDAMTAHSQQLPAIGVAGVDAWQSYFDRPLAGYDAVYVLADNDDKGQGIGFAEMVADRVDNVRIIPMPEGHDVNSFVGAEGYSALLDRIGLKA
jgi:DNA primase